MKFPEPDKRKILKAVFDEDAQSDHSERLSPEQASQAVGLLTLIAIELRKKIKLRNLHAKQKSS